MGDKFAYSFIIFASLLNLLLLLSSREYNKCKKPRTVYKTLVIWFSFFIHYFIHTFGLYGFLFNNKVILSIYLCIPVVIGAGWKLNKTNLFKSGCTLTNLTDMLCDIDKNMDTMNFIEIYRTMGVPDINIGFTKTSPAFLFITLVGYGIAIYKLTRKT